MRKVLCLSITAALFLFATTPASAQILKVEKNGNVLWEVLSAEDEVSLNSPKPSTLSVEKIGKDSPTPGSNILLSKSDGKISLIASSGQGSKELDVTDWKGSVVEIEERPETQKIGISLTDGKFDVIQKGISATTELPITIDPATAELSVKTQSGNKFLSVLPYDATQSVLRTKLINKINDDKIEITESNGELAYKISGEKVFNFFNIYKYSVPVSSYISASTGEVLKIDSPTIFKYLSFLFS